MRRIDVVVILLIGAVAGCSNGNLRSPSSYNAPRAPTVQQPSYDPYVSAGTANATWAPPVINRNATIVRPYDPGVMVGRPDYESAPWATGAAGGSVTVPRGTF